MVKIKEKLISFVKSKSFIIGAASFMLPALALYIIFIINQVHPFGDKQILVTDLWHQYYPFLCELQEKLKAGESVLYSENIGLGINFWALIAYYCASPLNFLVMLVNKDGLRDLLAVMVALKVGFTGLFFSLYLKKVFNKYDMSTVAFSMIYALCGYVLGYYWNIMWHDCVALLPLVMLGVYSLIKDGKWLLYVISLAVCVVSNFYIGFMVCIFTAIYFFYECAKEKMGIITFFKKLGLIAVTSVFALALTAFMTIPAYNALQNTVSVEPKGEMVTDKSFVTQIAEDVRGYAKELKKDSGDVIGRFASFNMPVPKEGLPNLFSGFVSIVLLGFFFTSKKIKLREKIASFVMILVLFLSIIISDIDIIWHGFHKPNMVPYRYAFVFSFTLIIIAYRTYVAEFCEDSGKDKKSAWMLIVPVIISAIVIFCASSNAVSATLLGCSALAIVYLLLLTSMREEKKQSVKEKWSTALCSIIVIEMVINTVIAVPTVRTTTYSTYYYRGEEIEQLLEEVGAESTYNRVETSQEYILNDPALYGYKGVSTFTSTANAKVSELMKKFAICGIPGSNRYYYETTSPLTNAVLGVKYIIFKNDMKNLNPYLIEAAAVHTEGNKNRDVIYENTQCLPIGFMVDESILDGALVGENPFEIQNDLFRKLTGLEEDLFTRVPLKSVTADSTVKVSGSKEGVYTVALEDASLVPALKINYVAPDENSIYAYVEGKEFSKIVVSNTTYKAAKRNYIFPAGEYAPEEKFTFKFAFEDTYKDKTTLKFHVYSMNEKLFEKGMALLDDEPFEIDTYKSTLIKGTVNAENDGVFYTSVPYEKGWSLYVDGVKTEITPFEEALIAVNLEKGEHEIVLKYKPDGFVLGMYISLVALAVLVLTILIMQRRKKYGQNINSSSLL